MTDEVPIGTTQGQAGYQADSAFRKIRRVKLGLLLASLAACLSVSLLALFAIFMLSLFDAFGGQNFFIGSGAATGMSGAAFHFVQGLQFGLILSLYNFILFFLTVPAAWLAMGLSIGRFPHRGIAARGPYVRWGAIWGMILVGGTTGISGGLIFGIFAGIGALLTGLLVGVLAGAVCGLLFYAIVKPAEQLHDADVSVF